MNTDEIVIAPALRTGFAAALERGRAVLFSAPCGYGKTAVARALLAGRRTAYADARAADFTLPDACGDWDTLLLDELPALRGEDCRALCALLRDAPDKRFVLLSRGPVPGWLLPLRAAGGLAVFSRAALALGQDEALRLLRARGAEPAAGQINDILRRTEGCPLALILAAPHLRSGGYTEETAAAVRAELFDYFDTAIFRRFDAGLRRFLLHLAPYGRFDLRLADRVCGGGAGELLDRLMGESALLCGDGVDAYRFHPFFRDFLLWEAERELGERERAALLDRAGSYYERRGEMTVMSAPGTAKRRRRSWSAAPIPDRSLRSCPPSHAAATRCRRRNTAAPRGCCARSLCCAPDRGTMPRRSVLTGTCPLSPSPARCAGWLSLFHSERRRSLPQRSRRRGRYRLSR